MKISFLYPLANILQPETGGQVYDNRLLTFIQNQNVATDVIDNEELGLSSNSRIKLVFKLIINLKKLSANKYLIFNTALFPYYILPFFLLRLLHPGIKIFGIHHHFRFQEQTGWRKWIYKNLEFLNLKQCTSVICPCPYTKDVMNINDKKIPAVSIINSFDAEIKAKSSFKYKHLLYVGSIYERKGLHLLIEAIGLLPKEDKEGLQLTLVGKVQSQKYYEYLESIIESRNLRGIIIFRGRLDDEELNKCYSESFAFVLPSLLEGFGLVIIEAMKYGLPVVAFDNSAMPYTIKDRYNGLLAENKSSESLSEKIHELINDEILHSQLSEGAYNTAMNCRTFHDMEQEVSQFIAELNTIH